jgi:UDP-N-acetyl-D-mannosaminuronic acid dehydrogenase
MSVSVAMSKSSNPKICVLGLGYIGLPTASMFASHGYRVHGVDTEPHVIATLRKGEVHIEEPGLSTIVKGALKARNLTVGPEPVASDVFVIAVQTPCRFGRGAFPRADLRHVLTAAKMILPRLRRDNLVILESTCPPGTSSRVLIPLLATSGLRSGEEFGFAYCPERVMPGKALKELVENDRVIGAVNETWGKKARDLYKAFVSGDFLLTDLTTAEMVKVLENTYRDVNIALANQSALMCEQLGISVWDVIEIANRHPRVQVHRPGPGVGGHCISVDPWFLVETFPRQTRLIQKARRINDGMPLHVTRQIKRLVQGEPVAKIALLGLAYKGNVDDIRESPAIRVIELLQKYRPKYDLAYYDPHVQSTRFPKQGLSEVLQSADLAVVLTAHDDFKLLDPQMVGRLMRRRVIYDTHHVLSPDRWVSAGFQYHALGMGHPAV